MYGKQLIYIFTVWNCDWEPKTITQLFSVSTPFFSWMLTNANNAFRLSRGSGSGIMFVCSVFSFLLFTTPMYNKIGYGKGDTVLTCVCIVLECPTYGFFLLWVY